MTNVLDNIGKIDENDERIRTGRMLCKLDINQIFGQPSETQEESSNGILTIVLRHQMFAKFKELREIHGAITNGYARSARSIIIGPAGSGKSYYMFTMTQFARKLGYVVFYIPSLSAYGDVSLSNEVVSNRMIQTFIKNNEKSTIEKILLEKVNLYDYLKNNEIDACVRLRKLIATLKTDINNPIFIAIDQWNAISSFADDNILKPMFNRFSYFSNNGMAIIAVSSTFDSLDSNMFDDADYYSKQFKMTSYTDAEISTLIAHKRDVKSLPPGNELSNSDIAKFSANLPRMVHFLEKSYRDHFVSPVDEHLATYNVTSHLQQAAKLATDYFTKRIMSVMNKSKSSTQASLMCSDFAFAAEMFTNNQHTNNYSDRWVNSGLFFYDKDTCVRPVCSVIIPSLYRIFGTDMIEQIMSVLATVPAFKGLAFEFCILAKFRNGNHEPISFKPKDLAGKHSDGVVVINIVKCIDQTLNLTKDDLSSQPYDKNTMVVCHQNHPAIDFVVYDNDIVYFFQCSLLSYSEHGNGATEILEKKMSNCNRNIMEYYLDMSPYSIHHNKTVKKWTPQLLKICKFIHITISDRCANSTTMKKPGVNKVLLLNDRNDLAKIFGQSIENFF